MSIIKDILSRLETVTHPVAQVMQKGDGYRIIAIGFRKQMILNDHKASMPSVLTVLNGKVNYRINNESTVLSQYDQVEIPVDLIHSVEALEDSLCLLTQGK